MTVATVPRIFLAVLSVTVLCAPRVFAGSEVELNPTRHIVEVQAGAGLLAGVDGIAPMAHLQARFALWRTIGFGVYAGGSYTGGDGIKGVVPLCGRLNLSLPFWRSFEPVLSIGAGEYIYFAERYGGGTHDEAEPGLHAALALLFPHKRHGFGLEGSLHLTADPYYSDSWNGFACVVGTWLIR